MIDLDNPQFAAGLVILIALVCPLIYSLWVDKHKKGSPDPRTVKF